MMKYSRCLLIGGICAAIAPGAQPVGAAESTPYPVRPVRVIVPFAPGGSDIVARMLAPKLSEKLGQSFVVENRPGAASILGTEIVAKSTPDGYTILFCTSSLATTAAYNKKLPYDPVRDFAGVAQVGAVPFVLVTHPALPVTSVKAFIALAKKRPGELFYSSPGTGGIGHLVNEYFAKQVGIKITHVAYKGTGPSMTALLTGEVQFGMPNISGALAMVRAKKVRTLGVAAEQRLSFAPELPTLRELGVDLVAGPWYGIVAPRGTPRHAIDLLNREVSALVKGAEMGEKLAARGVVVQTRSPQEFADFIKADIENWRGVMRAAGIEQE
jgi:tripartite-type tricarboxylate transporter receptor subunit TctC